MQESKPGNGTRMGISNLQTIFLELGDRPILIHTIEKICIWNQVLKKNCSWSSWRLGVSKLDLVENIFLSTGSHHHYQKGGADPNTSIEKIIEAINAYRSNRSRRYRDYA